MFESLKRKPTGEKALYIVVSIIFMVIALSYLYILFWTFMSGTKTHTEIVMNPFALPEKWNLSNYITVFSKFKVGDVGFLGMLFNSLYFSVLGPFLTNMCCITLAYCTMKYEFPGSKIVYPFIIAIMSLPIYGSGGAQYLLFYRLGLVDSYAQIVSAYNALVSTTLFYMAYYQNLSNSYIESAQMDGAHDFQVFYRIMFPLAKPIFGAFYLRDWLGSWNTWESVLVYLPSKPNLPVGIYKFNAEMIYTARLDILFAACMLVCIPALVLFTVFNKTLTTSVSMGGLKG